MPPLRHPTSSRLVPPAGMPAQTAGRGMMRHSGGSGQPQASKEVGKRGGGEHPHLPRGLAR